MFDYDELEVTGTFYIEFENKNDTLIAEDVEDLIRYWYRSWFNKLTNPDIQWINLNPFTNAVVKVQINLSECISSNYIAKDFLCATEHTKGDNRRSLFRTLTYGVNNTKTKISKIEHKFKIVNSYITKLPTVEDLLNHIPNPYLVKDFTVSTTKVTSNSQLVDYINNLVQEEETKWNKLNNEIDTDSKYQLMRKHLDKFEQLEIVVKALNKYLEM